MFSVTRTLRLPKEGNSDAQYEDASAVLPEGGGPTGALSVALSDGASSAIFAREWARLLADSFCSAEGLPASDDALFARVAELGAEWRAAVSGKATSWYAQERLPGGSSATLLLGRFSAGEGGGSANLSALAVGDVCLFVVRDGRLKYGFPKTRSRQFDDRPGLLTTEASAGPEKRPAVLRFETGAQPGDRFFLMTDALAQFFLAEFEAKRKPWDALPSPEGLAGWAKERRDAGTLKNDDVTLVEVACGAS